jgi:hypothetical protein
MKKIKNNDSAAHTWLGQTVQPGAYYTLQTLEETLWANDSTLLTAVAAGIAIVNDGASDFSDVNKAINYLKDIKVAAPMNPDNVPIVELNLRRSSAGFSNFTIVSHDLSDRTTWYQKSIAVVAETLTDSGDGLTFNSANPHWVNINGPKLTLDYAKVLERDGSLSKASVRNILIKVNGVAKVEGTDFNVNYPAGTVTFVSSQSGNTITANYPHNNGVAHCSEFLFLPPTDKMYRIEHVESQFSRNAVFTNPIMIEIWAGGTDGHSVNLAAYGGFAGAYFDAGYGQSRSAYRNVNDLINWCNNEYPIIPACGNLTQDVLCFPFLYIVHPVISAKQGAVIRLFTRDDLEITAEVCTVTLYMEKGPA